MKRLTKLRLINWHYFSNTTVDLKDITFLTGPNGTGKSTIIDAMQILILGTTRSDNFNKAANEKGRSGRNLLSYLRGQTGVADDGKVINLRPGNFTSYIAMEITDDQEDRVFTIGIVFDVDSADAIDKHFFYIDGPFPENDFSTGTDPNGKKARPLMYRELSAYLRDNYSGNHFRVFSSDTDYQNFIREAFGNLPEKYFSLFKKAVSFAPISDISSFITEYICDVDKKVDIGPMQKNIEQYKILEIEARNLKVKAESLAKIKETYESVRSYAKRLDMLSYVNARVLYEDSKKKLASLDDKLEKDNKRLIAISDQLAQYDGQIEELRKDLSSYQAKKLQSANYSLTEKLSMKKDGIARQITAIQMQVSSVMTKLNNYVHDYRDTTRSFVTFYSQFDSRRLGDKVQPSFDELIELCKDINGECEALIQAIDTDSVDFAAVIAFQKDMEQLRNLAIQVRSALNSELYQVSADLQSLQHDLSAVNSGQKPFDQIGPSYMAIKNSLETALKSRHSDSYVHIYCDLVDVNDKEWQQALEAVLFSQKFNFFVNPAYYEEANRLLKELCDNYRYYRVSLVDTERLLKANIEADPHSVAMLVDTKDEGARAYTDYLLGRIRKCETFDEARRSGSGLLSDCTGYRGFATWYLNKGNARIFFLGTQVSNDTKAVSAKDYQETNKRYSLYTEALNKIQNLLTLSVMSQNELLTYQSDIDRTGEISGLQQSLENVDAEMHDAAMGDMNEVQKKIDAIQADINTISKEREDLLTERGSLINETNRLNGEEIPVARRNKEDLEKNLAHYDEKVVNEEYDPFFNKLLDEQGMTLSQIKVEAAKEYIQASNKQNYDKSSLLRLRSDYCSVYHLNYDTTSLDSNAEFDKELENIEKVRLPEYEEKIKQAHEASIREFKDDFIYKLRTAIETVYSQIEELNQALSDSRFGRDSYQFKVTPNKDYIEYYDMIMDPLLLKAGDAEQLFMEKYKTTMDDLFNLISNSTSARGEEKDQVVQNIERFTTYTTYILFDLLVTRGIGENAQTISLGRSFKSQSGGETQTPFYIAILASFASLCRAKNPKDNNTLRLVIFDEAFSKMDAERIKKSTDLLRQFGLQAIISSPTEKLRDLVSYVDLILVAIHDDKRKRSGIDVYQERDKAERKAALPPQVPPVPPESPATDGNPE